MELLDILILLLFTLSLGGTLLCAAVLQSWLRRRAGSPKRLTRGEAFLWLAVWTSRLAVFLLSLYMPDSYELLHHGGALLLGLVLSLPLTFFVHRRQGGWRVQLVLAGLIACTLGVSAVFALSVLLKTIYPVFAIFSLLGGAASVILCTYLHRWRKRYLCEARRPVWRLAAACLALLPAVICCGAGLFMLGEDLYWSSKGDWKALLCYALSIMAAAGLCVLAALLYRARKQQRGRKVLLRLCSGALVLSLLTAAGAGGVVHGFKQLQAQTPPNLTADVSLFSASWAVNSTQAFVFQTDPEGDDGLFSINRNDLEDVQEILVPGTQFGRWGNICGLSESHLYVELRELGYYETDTDWLLYAVDLETLLPEKLDSSPHEGAFWYHAASDSLLRARRQEDRTLHITAEDLTSGEVRRVYESKRKYPLDCWFGWVNLEGGGLMLESKGDWDSAYIPAEKLMFDGELQLEYAQNEAFNKTLPEETDLFGQLTRRINDLDPQMMRSAECYGGRYFLTELGYYPSDSYEYDEGRSLYRVNRYGLFKTLLREGDLLHTLHSLDGRLFSSGSAWFYWGVESAYSAYLQGVFELSESGGLRDYIGLGNHLLDLGEGLLMSTHFEGEHQGYGENTANGLRGLYPGEFAGLYDSATGKRFPALPLPEEEEPSEPEGLPLEEIAQTTLPEQFSTLNFAYTPQVFYRCDTENEEARLRRVNLKTGQEETLPLPLHEGTAPYSLSIVGVTDTQLYFAGHYYGEQDRYPSQVVFRLAHGSSKAEFIKEFRSGDVDHISLSPAGDALIYVAEEWDWSEGDEVWPVKHCVERYDLRSGEVRVLYDAMNFGFWLNEAQYAADGKLAISTLGSSYIVIDKEGRVRMQEEEELALVNLYDLEGYTTAELGDRWLLLLQPGYGFMALVERHGKYVLR